MKILVVDDISTLRETLVTALRAIGFNKIQTAFDGLDAFEKAEACSDNEPFEIVLTDITMPNCTGIELVAKIRGLDAYKKIPIIMVSTETEKTTIIDAISAGADDYILKPYTAKLLQEKLESVFKKKGIR